MSQRRPVRKTRPGVHLAALLPFQPGQQAAHHCQLVCVHSHQQGLVDLPEVELDTGQQHISDGLVAQADGQIEGPPPGAVLSLLHILQGPAWPAVCGLNPQLQQLLHQVQWHPAAEVGTSAFCS